MNAELRPAKMSRLAILNHPWLPNSGPDAVTVRGFVYDVDTGRLDEVAHEVPLAATG